jgi:hypothetical protein
MLPNKSYVGALTSERNGGWIPVFVGMTKKRNGLLRCVYTFDRLRAGPEHSVRARNDRREGAGFPLSRE